MARKKQQQNNVRIIAGKWRGRKIEFVDTEGLRPTPDRVRETLFNWLQTIIPGAVCIDCFAGSGALGFEAASRGAKKVTLIETNPVAVAQLKQSKEKLEAENVGIISASALNYFQEGTHNADIFFLDPPFTSNLLQATLEIIIDNNILKSDGMIYLEYPENNQPELPQGWRWYRQKKTGEVGYGLLVKVNGKV